MSEEDPISGKKRSRTGIVLCVCAVVAFVGWILIPYFRGLYKLGCIDSAIGTLRILTSEETHFAEAHPERGYACAISELDASKLPERLGQTGYRSGYMFEIVCGPEGRDGTKQTFKITARPIHSNMPVYCVDQSGVIKYDEGGSSAKCLQSGTSL
jgi:hypothetical protein